MESDPLSTTYINDVEVPLAFLGGIVSVLTDSPFWLGPTSMLKNHNITVLALRDACHSLTVMIPLHSWYHYENPVRKYSLLTWSAEWEVGSFRELWRRGGSKLSLFYSVHHPDFQVCITFQSMISPSLHLLTEARRTLSRLISILSSLCGH